MTTPQAEMVDAPLGERTVVIRVRFFTNKLADRDQVRPKHVHAAGMVEMEANETHGIAADATSHVKFNSLAELPAAIEEMLVRFGIRVHPTPRMRQYLEPE